MYSSIGIQSYFSTYNIFKVCKSMDEKREIKRKRVNQNYKENIFKAITHNVFDRNKETAADTLVQFIFIFI